MDVHDFLKKRLDDKNYSKTGGDDTLLTYWLIPVIWGNPQQLRPFKEYIRANPDDLIVGNDMPPAFLELYDFPNSDSGFSFGFINHLL